MVRRFVITLASLIFTVTTANAATIDLPVTGQTECFDSSGAPISCTDSGQDGEIQAGVSRPIPRFTDNGDGTITDNLTGLMWLKDVDCGETISHDPDAEGSGNMFWQSALDFVAGINNFTHDIKTCSWYSAGYTDWRIPNINELISIIDYSQSSPALTPGHPFDNIANVYFWSSTTLADYVTGDPDVGIGVRLLSGQTASSKKSGALAYSMKVWPVRDSSVIPVTELPKTGQTNCYDSSGAERACAGTGEDGEYQKGVSWPISRFTDNGDGTITDELTGLMWIQNNNCFTYKDWDTALNAIDDINNNPENYKGAPCNYTSTYSDWRLPNILELNSITNYAYYEADCGGTPCDSHPAWLNNQGFVSVLYSFWSSSNDYITKDDAWVLGMQALNFTSPDKVGSNLVIWPARGGEVDLPDIDVSSLSINFGSVAVGDSSDQMLTITNVGELDLHIDTLTDLTDPFIYVEDNCSNTTLVPAADCTVTIGFDPPTEGIAAGSFDIPSNDPDEESVEVTLTGEGTATHPDDNNDNDQDIDDDTTDDTTDDTSKTDNSDQGTSTNNEATPGGGCSLINIIL